MAFLEISAFSESLMRQVTFNAVVPTDNPPYSGRQASPARPLKTVYLLHGMLGNESDWFLLSRVPLYAHERGVAVIMPAGANSFYVDQPDSHSYFGQFVGDELVRITRALLPLSADPADTAIAGLSMGGYGALRNGLRYGDTFGWVAALSAPLDLAGMAAAPDDPERPLFGRRFRQSVFGDLSQLVGSDKDPLALVRRRLAEHAPLPRLYVACGTDDALVESNRRFRDALTELKVPLRYVETAGGHEWRFWDRQIEQVLDWFTGRLPDA